MLTYIHLSQTDRSEGLPKATCNSSHRLLTVSPTASGLGRWRMNPIAPSPQLDLDNAESRLPSLQGDPDLLTILRIVQWALKGVPS